MEIFEFTAMNTLVQLAAEGDPIELQPVFARAQDLIAAGEARFSRFLPTSELSRLNRSAEGWFLASPELFSLIQEALDLYLLTDGFFDPSISRALIAAGYDRSMDEIRLMENVPIKSGPAYQRIPLDEIRLDARGLSIKLPAGMQIDLGGIAKGWIAARAVNLLRQYSSAAAVSVGGDMVLSGLPASQPGWQVSLEDPRDEQHVLAVLNLQPGSLATSSVTRRRWLQGGQPRHHIIDPRTGASAEVSWLSISVYAQKATQAEAFAKALLIAGPTQAGQLAARLQGLYYIAVNPDGSLVSSQASEELIYERQ
jgi:FAD:protein FMN transferase